MSLKLVMGFIFFGILSVYVAFLNPQDINLRVTQSFTLKIPVIVLLLASIVVGVAISGLSEGLRSVRRIPASLRMKYLSRRRESLRNKRDKLYGDAENALVAGNLKKARSLFEKVLSVEPDHVPSLIHYGDVLRKEGKLGPALEVHARAIKHAPRHIQAHFSLAADHTALNQPEKSLEVLQKIQEYAPDSIALLRRQRDACLHIPDWQEAALHQKAILRLASDMESHRERRRLGEIIYRNANRHHLGGDIDSAKSEFKRAIKESGDSVPAFVSLGDLYFNEDLRKDALKVWKEGFSKTNSLVCLQRIRWIGDDDAVKLAESAVRTSAEPHGVAILLAGMYLEKGENEKAVRVLNDSSENAPLLHQILLITARQAVSYNGQLPDALRAVLNKIQQSLAKYVCRECFAVLTEWSCDCPSCNSWDSVVWEPKS